MHLKLFHAFFKTAISDYYWKSLGRTLDVFHHAFLDIGDDLFGLTMSRKKLWVRKGTGVTWCICTQQKGLPHSQATPCHEPYLEKLSLQTSPSPPPRNNYCFLLLTACLVPAATASEMDLWIGVPPRRALDSGWKARETCSCKAPLFSSSLLVGIWLPSSHNSQVSIYRHFCSA